MSTTEETRDVTVDELRGMIKEVVEKAPAEFERPEQRCWELISQDRTLMKAALAWAVRELVRDARKEIRRAAAPAMSKRDRRALPDNPAALIYLAVAERRCMDHVLTSGLRLAEAKKADLEEEYGILADVHTDLQLEMNWIQAIAARLPRNKQVKDAFTEDDLDALRPEAAK